jgi:putative aldouronate transport system substrate-binding protein
MFKKGKYSLISVLLLSIILTGCSQVSQMIIDNSKPGLETSTPKTLSPITFDYYINFNWWVKTDWGNDLSSKEITRLTGVTLKIGKPDNAIEPLAKLNLMLSSGTFPDMLMMGDSVISKKLIHSNAIIPLDGLIENYGQDIKKNIGIDYLTEYCREDNGSIYGLPNGVNYEGMSPDSGAGFLVLEQLYKDLGSPPLNTLDDLYSYLVKVREAAKKNKNNETIMPSYIDWPCLNLAGSFGLRFVSCYEGSYVYGEDNKLHEVLREPKAKQLFQFTNKLFCDNLIDPNWLLQDSDTVLKKQTFGTYAVYLASNAYGWLDEFNEKVKKQSGDSYVLIKPPLAEGVTDPKYNLYSKKPWTKVYISSRCKDPVRAMKFMNWLASDDGQIISGIGPKGVVWEVGKDRNPTVTETFAKKMSSDKEKALTEIGYLKWCMLQNKKFLNKAGLALMNETERKERAASAGIISDSIWYAPELDKLSLDVASQVGIINTKLNTYFTKMDKRLYLAENEAAFESRYSEMLREMEKIGVSVVENELNKQIEENRK